MAAIIGPCNYRIIKSIRLIWPLFEKVTVFTDPDVMSTSYLMFLKKQSKKYFMQFTEIENNGKSLGLRRLDKF